MNILRQTFSAALLVAVVAVSATATQAWQRPYRMNDRQVEAALRRVETDADSFRSSFANALDRSRFNGTSTEDQLNGYATADQVVQPSPVLRVKLAPPAQSLLHAPGPAFTCRRPSVW